MWTHCKSRLISIVSILIVLPISLLSQASWQYVETPDSCEFIEAVVFSNGKIICLSDSCGIYLYTVSDGSFQSILDTRESSNVRFVPRSITTTNKNEIVIVGHAIYNDSAENKQLHPRVYRSNDSGLTWSVYESEEYGKYQQVRVVRENGLVIAFEKRVPFTINDYDSYSVFVQVLLLNENTADMGIVLDTLSRWNEELSSCYLDDHSTMRLTSDREFGVSLTSLTPCQLGILDPPESIRYPIRGWFSYDGGQTFPDDYWVPQDPWGTMWSRNDSYYGPLYLTGDFWIGSNSARYQQEMLISRDQGKSWRIERIPISHGTDSLSIAELNPAIIRDRLAAGCYRQEYTGPQDVFAFGTFNLDDGFFRVEHRDTLKLWRPSPVFASESGYALVTFVPHGMYVRIPSEISSVDVESRYSLRVYPSPAADEITVAGTTETDTLLVESILGNRVMELHNKGFTTTFDISSLPSGPYVLRNGSTSQALLFHVLR